MWLNIGKGDDVNSEKGQSLIEVLIVAGLVGLMLVGVVSLMTVSVANSRKTKARSAAIRSAQEGVEWVRQQRDTMPWYDFTDISDIYGPSVTFCAKELSAMDWEPTSHGACDPNMIADTYSIGNVKYWRQFIVENLEGVPLKDPRYKVTVEVFWQEGLTTPSEVVETFVNRKRL